jgi:hypothetical protein
LEITIMVRVKAASSFAHGADSYARGQEFDVSEQLADELQKAGLITRSVPASDAKMEPPPGNKVQQPVANKAIAGASGTSHATPAQPVQSVKPKQG